MCMIAVRRRLDRLALRRSMVHQGRIGEIIQAKPEQRRRVLEEAAGISGLHARRHEAELRLRAAEANLLRASRTWWKPARRPDRRAEAPGAPGDPLSQPSRPRSARSKRTLFHLRWLGANAEVMEAEPRQGPQRARGGRGHRSRRPRQAMPARPRPKPYRRCARPRPAPARGAATPDHRARARSTPKRPAPASGSPRLDRRLAQFEADVERERALVTDAETALAQLAEEEETLRQEAQNSAERRYGVDTRVAAADAVASRSREDNLRRTDRPTRRSDRAPQRSFTRTAPRAGRAHRADGCRACQHRGRNCTAAAESRPDIDGTRRSAPKPRRPPSCRAKRTRSPPRRRISRRASAPKPRASRSPKPSAPCNGLDTEAKTLMKLLDGRDPEHVAAGDRQHHGRQGLRGGARRSAGRRPRCAGRSAAVRCAGPARRSIRPTLRCRRALEPLAKHVQAPPSWRAVSVRSAWSKPPTARASQRC